MSISEELISLNNKLHEPGEKVINFVLMNTDTSVLSFRYVQESPIEFYYEEIETFDGILPLGFVDVESWLNRRKAPKHRKHIKRLSEELGCTTLVGYIKLTHAVSLNDTYWVKHVDEDISWRDISPYTNDFSEVVAHYAFTGNLAGKHFSGTTPELSTDGAFPKCWVRDSGNIYLCKAGSEENQGVEVLLECCASMVYERLCKDSVRYTRGLVGDVQVSRCKLATSEEYGFISIANYLNKDRVIVQELYELYDNLGCAEKFRRLVIADAIVMNTDRHLGNIGLVVRNSTQEVVGMFPVFDFNKALLPDLTLEIYEDAGRYKQFLANQSPKIGTGFISVAKYFLNDTIKDDLVTLYEYLTQEGSDWPQEYRAGIAKELVCQNIKAILS